MTFSRPILATDKTKLNWWNYWIEHCWLTGWTSIYNNFHTWMDLVWFPENQKNYALQDKDNPFEECYLTFWYDLNEDDTYPKEFLEDLMEMTANINLDDCVPLDENFFDDLEDLYND
jgi:hypothetical protein